MLREAREETGWLCEPIALAGVFDSRRCGSIARHHMYQFVFLCRPIRRLENVSHAHETLDMAWFSEENLPDAIAPGHTVRIPVAFAKWRALPNAYFDL
ncbi:MAG: NUDIX domain-containing protein [Caldilineaceae bacterium]|nr:NUDIX domain-containing protein [Caldilineaceae bacterium]